MGEFATGDPELAHWSIPLDGLHFILTGWMGQGRLFTALASVGDGIDLAWSEEDVRARAMRMVIESVRENLFEWPTSVDEWLTHLPVSSTRENATTRTPRGRIDWLATVKQHGWPPAAYVSTKRSRELSDITIEVLAWTVERLKRAFLSIDSGGDLDYGQLLNAVTVADDALKLCTTSEQSPRPDFHDLKALSTSGLPWTYVRPVAEVLLRSETDLKWFATQMLMPDKELRWRLFHLAVTGSVLRSLQRNGFSVDWNAPIGADGASSKPTFTATAPNKQKLDIWFESQSASREYFPAVSTPYQNSTCTIRKRESSIGADIAIYDPDTRAALLVECKFGRGSYVARAGFHQACGYLLDHSLSWETIWSFVVGPSEVIDRINEIDLSETRKIGFARPDDLDKLMERFVHRASRG